MASQMLGGIEAGMSDLFNSRVSQSGSAIFSSNRNVNASGGPGSLFNNLGGRSGDDGLFSNLGARGSSNANSNS